MRMGRYKVAIESPVNDARDENSMPVPAPSGLEIAPGVMVSEGLFRWQFSRSSGPGGQNVNKVNTRAELWLPMSALATLPADTIERLKGLLGKRLTQAAEIHLVGETGRSQSANRAAALERLRELLIAAMHRPKKRRRSRPTYASKQRRLEGKKRRGNIKSARRPPGSE